MERTQFTFYRSYYDAITALPKKDQSALLLAICIICLGGCEEKKTKNINADQNGEYILIVTKKASLSEQTAQYISASLSRLGYSSLIKYEEQAGKMKRGGYL